MSYGTRRTPSSPIWIAFWDASHTTLEVCDRHSESETTPARAMKQIDASPGPSNLTTVHLLKLIVPRLLSVASLVGICLLGCAPDTSEPPPSRESQEAQLPIQPEKEPFTFLADLATTENLPFKSFVAECVPTGSDWRFEWVGFDQSTGEWEVAFFRSWSFPAIRDRVLGLEEMLEETYPLHKADFVVPVEVLEVEGQLTSLPITLAPDFVFVRNTLDWSGSPTPEAFQSYLGKGEKIGLPPAEPGMWYRKNLEIPADRVVELSTDGKGNPYVEGTVDVAIHDRSWLLDQGIPGNEIHSLAEIGLEERVPDWGYRIAISNDCKDIPLAKEILKSILVSKHDMLIGLGGRSFPVRKSIYQSPRMQGALITAPRQVFDRTLENLLMQPAFPAE